MLNGYLCLLALDPGCSNSLVLLVQTQTNHWTFTGSLAAGDYKIGSIVLSPIITLAVTVSSFIDNHN